MLDEMQTIVQAATMYYQERLNQTEIAKKLNTTRQSVSKLLKNAERLGIVEFRIHNPLETLGELGKRLQERYGLRNAVVVPCSFEESDLIATTIAPYAAKQVELLIAQGCRKIGLAWGRTMDRTVSSLPLCHCEDATVFPLVGASSRTAKYFMLNDMVRRMADQLNARSAYAYIPADPGSPEDARLFRRTAVYETIKSQWQSIDLAVLGVGVHPRYESGGREAYPGEKGRIPDAAVGDMITHYFDSEGRFLPAEYDLLCADVDDLRNAKHVLAVAGGREKTAAISGALKTGLITALVTDEQTCERLLS